MEAHLPAQLFISLESGELCAALEAFCQTNVASYRLPSGASTTMEQDLWFRKTPPVLAMQLQVRPGHGGRADLLSSLSP